MLLMKNQYHDVLLLKETSSPTIKHLKLINITIFMFLGLLFITILFRILYYLIVEVNENNKKPTTNNKSRRKRMSFITDPSLLEIMDEKTFHRDCSQILSYLFIGNFNAARNRNKLKQLGITHIINCCNPKYNPNIFPNDFVYVSIPVHDSRSENILQYFESTSALIEQIQLSGGKILVHCALGISRSVTLVMAYLLKANPTLSVTEILSLVRKSRPCANPNEGFIKQLEIWRVNGYKYRELGLLDNFWNILFYKQMT
jgi:protein-tyrosine phosphatase